MLIIFNNVLLLLIVLLLSLLIIYIKWLLNYWKRKNVATASYINSFRTCKLFKEIDYKRLKENGEKFYGTYVLLKPALIAIDPEFIKSIMIKDFSYFNERGFYSNPKTDPLSYSFTNATVDTWKKIRLKLSSAFTSNRLKLMFNTINECGDMLMDDIDRNYYQTNRPIDAKDISARFTMEITGCCIFGLDFMTIKDPKSKFCHYGRKAFQPDPILKMKRSLLKFYPSFGLRFGMKQLDSGVSNFVLNFVRETIKFRNNNNNYKRDDIMQILIDNMNGDDPLTVEEVAAQLFIFFAAGFEGPSTMGMFAMYELARNDDIQEKVRDELRNVLRKYDGKITYDSLDKMKYLEQVLYETMRMYPAFYNMLRRCCENYKIPNTNVVIDKGTIVAIPLFALHYDEEYFPDPNKFDPDRFSKDNIQNRKPCVYMPFGEGPRICIGLRLGMMEIKIAIAKLLCNYELSVNAQTKPIAFNYSVDATATFDPIYLNVKKIKL